MPYHDIAEETDQMGQLSNLEDEGMEMGGMPQGGMPMQGAPSGMPMDQPPGGPPTGATGPTAAPGGPGPDTPQEQQALQLLMQGAQAFRQAASVEPSIRYIVDKHLQGAYLEITKHYGMEQEGKLALQQAQLRSNKQRSAGMTGPPRPARPPMGA
jgi:hypothetical protein